MTLRVPYIADESIERDAEALLVQFAHARGVAIGPPIPIEDIVEKHLKLHVEFDDLHRLLGVPRGGFGTEPDIFGAIWLETGEIVIDESLDPEVRPAIEGRYRFTLGHEGGGHWRLHRPLVEANRCPAPFRTHRAGPQADGAGRCRPTEPHWYLSLIGVE